MLTWMQFQLKNLDNTMKKVILLIALVAISLCADAQKRRLELTNKLDFARTDELIVVDRAYLEKKFERSAQGKYIQAVDGNTPLVVQHDDLDGDGIWDEIAFLTNFTPSQKKIIVLGLAESPSAVKAVVKAHVRLRKKDPNDRYGNDLEIETMPQKNQPNDFTKTPIPLYKTEGPAWENDKVAFRSYFDVRNAKDIFGKTTSAIVMDTVGTYGDKFYHHFDESWGMDILKVGKSLGAGALAIKINSASGKDTLIRVTGEHADKTVYRKIADGPVRAIFSITYDGWDPMRTGSKATLVETTSIWGGQYFYENSVHITGLVPKEIVTGIVNLKPVNYEAFSHKKNRVIYSYGVQSENNDNLGMAILTNEEEGKKVTEVLSADIVSTHFLYIKFKENKDLKYRFYAGWEKSNDRFSSLSTFKTFMEEQAQLYNSKIQVSWE